MGKIVDIHHLAKIGLFAGLTEEQVAKVAKVISPREYPTKAIIIHEGEIGSELFMLLSGDIEITKRLTLSSSAGSDIKDKSLIRLKDSDNVFFGEMSMFGSEERSATVAALTPVTLGVLTRDQVTALAEQDPDLGFHIYYNIGQKLAGNLRRANRDILKLTTAFCLALEGK